MKDLLEAAPGLCGCEECIDKEDLDMPQEDEQTNQKSSCNKDGVGLSVTLGTQSKLLEGSRLDTTPVVPAPPQDCGPQEQQDEPLQFVTDSVKQRGNRNKARLIREKREKKEKRTNKFK